MRITELQKTIQDSEINGAKIYPNDIIKVIEYSSSDLTSDTKTCKAINTQLKILCEKTELNSEYAFCSMLANKLTLVVTREPLPDSINMMTRLMALPKVIGFISYSEKTVANCLDKYQIEKINQIIPSDLLTDEKNVIIFQSKPTIVIDVIVTGQGAKGLGSTLLKHMNSTHNIFLKSVNTAYWFYIKQGFKHFTYDPKETKYVELPYKSCDDTYFFTGFYKKSPIKCYAINASKQCPGTAPDSCKDLSEDNFKSWYIDHAEDFPDDKGLIPLILPMHPMPPAHGGASNKSLSEYVTVLGRRRKIIMQGRKKMVMVSGDLISLADAKKKQ